MHSCLINTHLFHRVVTEPTILIETISLKIRTKIISDAFKLTWVKYLGLFAVSLYADHCCLWYHDCCQTQAHQTKKRLRPMVLFFRTIFLLFLVINSSKQAQLRLLFKIVSNILKKYSVQYRCFSTFFPAHFSYAIVTWFPQS